MKRVENWDSPEFSSIDVEGELIALAASAAASDVQAGEGTVPDTLDEVHEGSSFVIPLLIPEELESGDGRKMAKDALTTRDLPIPLLWQPATGEGHDQSYIVGRIDTVDRVENGLGNARGVFDTGPYGREAERLVRAKMLRGVSADLDQFEATVDGPEDDEFAGDGEETPKGDKIKSEKLTVNKARVMAATLVAKPAFQECTIVLGDEFNPETIEESGPMTDGIYEETPPTADAAEASLSALAASAAPVTPPSAWFDNPNLNAPTPLTVDDDGRVYGHIATWDTDHIGMGYGVKPPRSRSNYAYFRTGLIRTEEGVDIAVGQLTLAGGHASLDKNAHQAVKHYDDTASAVADVSAGEDAFGIWVAGGLRPGVTADQVRTLRASAPSGDWRPINNSLELVAVCQVNVPGFPIARARVASGSVMALVAAGAQTLHKIRRSEVEELSSRVDALERQLLAQKKAELAARIAPAREDRMRKLREAAANARAIIAPELDKRAQLSTRADEIRSQFKSLYVPTGTDFKENLHPRDDHGKFRKVLGRLTDILHSTDGANDPQVAKAQAELTKAADLEDKGDIKGAQDAAGNAAQQLNDAADSMGGKVDGSGATDAPEGDKPKARLGDQLHAVAHDIGGAIADVAKVAGKATEVAKDTATGGEVGSKSNKASNEIPPEFQDLIDQIVDQIGEGVDPVSITSRMDGKLKHWLEGKGFQSPQDLVKVIEKLLQRPIQPGIAQ